MNKLLFISQSDCKTEPAINGQDFKFSNAYSTTEIAANDTAAVDQFTALISSEVFRVTNIVRENLGKGKYHNEANLFNDQASIKVEWNDNLFSPKIYVGQIVSPKIGSEASCINGRINIQKLHTYERPNAKMNLFNLIPHAWVKDRELVKRGSVLMDELSDAHRLLFNAIFLDHNRFERFCKQPSSMIGHHSEQSGNFRHTVEVAEEMRKQCKARDFTNMDLGILSALLHDAGKADEYIMNDKGGWCMTERGKLLGHKVTVVEWIAAVVAKWDIALPENHYVGLLHIFTSAANAPEYLGIREPALHESFLLSLCDRLSGRDDLIKQTKSDEGGFGRSHRHLKAPVFTLKG